MKYRYSNNSFIITAATSCLGTRYKTLFHVPAFPEIIIQPSSLCNISVVPWKSRTKWGASKHLKRIGFSVIWWYYHAYFTLCKSKRIIFVVNFWGNLLCEVFFNLENLRFKSATTKKKVRTKIHCISIDSTRSIEMPFRDIFIVSKI